MSTRGQLAVRFASDEPGSGRLILAQDGRSFAVGRLPHDPPGPALLWFEWEDEELAPELAGLYFSRDDRWADDLFPAPVEGGPPTGR